MNRRRNQLTEDDIIRAVEYTSKLEESVAELQTALLNVKFEEMFKEVLDESMQLEIGHLRQMLSRLCEAVKFCKDRMTDLQSGNQQLVNENTRWQQEVVKLQAKNASLEIENFKLKIDIDELQRRAQMNDVLSLRLEENGKNLQGQREKNLAQAIKISDLQVQFGACLRTLTEEREKKWKMRDFFYTFYRDITSLNKSLQNERIAGALKKLKDELDLQI